ncbi:MAG: hypothetical protein IJ721_09710 [Bacteroidales bacterium]|nr:hypothetical protein [Bacteroidales bacterium]
MGMLLAGLVCLTGCYDDYVLDYDYSGVYVAYQYDLRTFVVGEDPHFDFTVALAGVLENRRDRALDVVLDPGLVTGDLSGFAEGSCAAFTALDGMLDKAPLGTLSQGYVTTAFTGVSGLTPLPEAYYTVSGLSGMKIAKGEHTAVATVRMQEAMLDDPAAFTAGYALGFQVRSADADTLLREKSFAVIGVRCENKFYGNWYHGGRTTVMDGDDLVSESVYETTVPQAEADLCILKTLDGTRVLSDKVGDADGSLVLTFAADGTVAVTSPDVTILSSEGSRFNGARLLQDRQIYLHYTYETADGALAYVTDTLTFRNRIRDGVNEWQDENPENYR